MNVEEVTPQGDGYVLEYTVSSYTANGRAESVRVHGFDGNESEVCRDYAGDFSGGDRRLQMYCAGFPAVLTTSVAGYEDFDSFLSDQPESFAREFCVYHGSPGEREHEWILHDDRRVDDVGNLSADSLPPPDRFFETAASSPSRLNSEGGNHTAKPTVGPRRETC